MTCHCTFTHSHGASASNNKTNAEGHNEVSSAVLLCVIDWMKLDPECCQELCCSAPAAVAVVAAVVAAWSCALC